MMVELVSTNLLALYIWREIGEEMVELGLMVLIWINCQSKVSNREEILHE